MRLVMGIDDELVGGQDALGVPPLLILNQNIDWQQANLTY